jgi:hypothetical protein
MYDRRRFLKSTTALAATTGALAIEASLSAQSPGRDANTTHQQQDEQGVEYHRLDEPSLMISTSKARDQGHDRQLHVRNECCSPHREAALLATECGNTI